MITYLHSESLSHLPFENHVDIAGCIRANLEGGSERRVFEALHSNTEEGNCLPAATPAAVNRLIILKVLGDNVRGGCSFTRVTVRHVARVFFLFLERSASMFSQYSPGGRKPGEKIHPSWSHT